jgi:YD repeat-containing protein
MRLTTIVFVFAAACGGSSGPHFAQDAGLPGNKACQVDWLVTQGDEREIRTFDDHGVLVHAVWSWVGGAEFMIEDFITDGDLLLDARFTEPSGAVEQHDRLSYDDQRRLTRYEQDGYYGTGTNADGTLDLDLFYTYDSTGHLARVDYDDNGDGIPEPSHYELVTWDVNGCATGDDLYAPGARDRSIWTYARGCVLTRVDHDYNADGSIDAVETWTYDAQGRLIAEHTLDGGDRTYLYDDQGRTSEVLTSEGTQKFTYCPGIPAALTTDSPRARTPGRAWDRRW